MPGLDEILEKLDRDALLQKASSIAQGAQCQFEGDPIVRSDLVIFKIRFPVENKALAARIPFEQEYPFLKISVQPLQFLERAHPSIPAPRIHAYFDVGDPGENPVGVAYMLMDWMEGHHMPPWDLTTPPAKERKYILDQLASIMLEMLVGSPTHQGLYFYGVPEGTPPHTPVNTEVWLTESIDRAIRCHIRQKKPYTVIEYLVQRSMLQEYIVHCEHDSWVTCHPDLRGANILINDDYTIVGIIDWDLLSFQPLQKHAVFPKLIDHIPGAAPPDLPLSHQYIPFTTDKQYFLSAIRREDIRRTGDTEIARILENSSERNFFELSIHSSTVHKEWVHRYCPTTRQNFRIALRELEKFLRANRKVGRKEEGVLEVRRVLKEGILEKGIRGRLRRRVTRLTSMKR